LVVIHQPALVLIRATVTTNTANNWGRNWHGKGKRILFFFFFEVAMEMELGTEDEDVGLPQ